MDMKKVLLLIGALVVAGISAMTVKNIMSGSAATQAAAAPAVPQGPKVLVAKRALAVGTIIDDTMLGYQPWPAELVQNAYYQQGQPDGDVSKLLGTVVRTAITAGQPLTKGALVGPQDRGFLAAALGPGMRAVTMPVSVISGVGGFIFPGDHVDLVLTQEVNGNDGGLPLKVSETIVRNVRILATDMRVSNQDAEGKQVGPMRASNVTVEVTPRLAEKLAVAARLGEISLVLRSLADTGNELEKAIASGDVKLPAGATPADEKKMLAGFAARPQDGSSSFSTGGDVSRFQRRSIPRQGVEPPAQSLAAAAAGGPAGPTGPVVRVARGNNVSIVSVGGR